MCGKHQGLDSESWLTVQCSLCCQPLPTLRLGVSLQNP